MSWEGAAWRSGLDRGSRIHRLRFVSRSPCFFFFFFFLVKENNYKDITELLMLRVSYRNFLIIKSDGPWAWTRAADSRVRNTTNNPTNLPRSACVLSLSDRAPGVVQRGECVRERLYATRLVSPRRLMACLVVSFVMLFVKLSVILWLPIFIPIRVCFEWGWNVDMNRSWLRNPVSTSVLCH